MTLFKELMTYRNTVPMQLPFVNALNQVIVTFHGEAAVIGAWDALFDVANVEGEMDTDLFATRKMDLLNAMSRSLGFDAIGPHEIGRFYQPTLFFNATARQDEAFEEWIRVLKASSHFGGARPTLEAQPPGRGPTGDLPTPTNVPPAGSHL